MLHVLTQLADETGQRHPPKPIAMHKNLQYLQNLMQAMREKFPKKRALIEIGVVS